MMDVITLVTYFLYFFIPFLVLYLYMSRNNDFWKNQGLPFIKPFPFLGHLDRLIIKKMPFHEFDMKYYKELGPIFGGFEGPKPYLFVGDAEIVKNILIKDFNVFPLRRDLGIDDEFFKNMVVMAKGEKWKRIRNYMTPAFSSGKMRKMSKVIDECARATCANLEKVTSQKSVDVKRICGAFTMDVIASAGFGIKFDSHNDPNNPFVTHASKIFTKDMTLTNLLLFLMPKLAKYIKGVSLVPKDVTDFFKGVIQKLLADRRNETNKDNNRVDFLQLMIDAREVEKENQTGNDNTSNKGMTEIEILAQCILFFIAGYETTATTISFVLYHLAQYPEFQDRLADEVNSVLKETDGLLDYDIIKRMPYLNAVVSETLRILPPAVRLERQALTDYEIESPPIKIPKGTIVGIPVYAMHRDPSYFPNPEQFDPERFVPENKDSNNLDAYIPFGGGPRNCIAMRFALLEAKICVAKVISRLRFSVSEDTQIPLKFFSTQGQLVPRDVRLKVDLRGS